jgi:hypothetical protein
VVGTYAPLGVHTYEVLNEENIAQPNQPYLSGAAYTSILRAVYPVIHANDPKATVLLGGFSSAPDTAPTVPPSQESEQPYTYLRGLYAAGAEPYFDAVSVHPYSTPDLPSGPDPWNPFQYVPIESPANPYPCAGVGNQDCMHSIMKSNGDAAKKLWITETGAESSLDPDAFNNSAGFGSQAFQSQDITQTFALGNALNYVGPVIFNYLWTDDAPSVEQIPSSPVTDDYYGLLTSSGTPKLAYTAFRDAVKGTSTNVTLSPGQTLQGSTDQRLINPDSGAVLIMQDDGNLVLQNAQGTPLWSTQTWGHPGASASLSQAGRLVVSAPDGTPLWSSPNPSTSGAELVLQNVPGQQLVITGLLGRTVWNAGL